MLLRKANIPRSRCRVRTEASLASPLADREDRQASPSRLECPTSEIGGTLNPGRLASNVRGVTFRDPRIEPWKWRILNQDHSSEASSLDPLIKLEAQIHVILNGLC
ncbi:uncharacterized protein PGTG_01722 [Puccinia graminis f. sp. tritici CRL 75-36-700-3]|uniref:Uncharacterized protein n=2 Tax=Puccinia graminis f. sp. tritici TaxID=56615 RepID=E3JSV4_PUCGT|nr:uncharacterized protein PGTG_01722 [Puccinia graminis f. sp. tritici CRL 75-36-700-3]EFP75129.1 hypothetical protein PGTG_01722 [Puccinia graminis f. sp. tritici CRL 75-36-700-3]